MTGAPSRSVALAALALAALTAGAAPAQRPQLDATGAFFAAGAGAVAVGGEVAGVVATTTAGPVTAEAYRRYPGRGARLLEDLGFDFVLARECDARGLARSAPTLARALAARRLLESRRGEEAADDALLRARFATEALRELRVDALVGRAREVDPAALKALFDHRHGVDGVRVRVRHVLAADGRARALAWRARVAAGEPFEALLAESDDRQTRRLLRDPERAGEAGVVAGYNYGRFGADFAAAVRALEVGAVSDPVRSPVGWHLVQVVERRVTPFDRVEGALKKELGGGKATRSEIDRLRRALLDAYEFRPVVAPAAPALPPTDWPHYRGGPRLHGVAPGSLGSKPELLWTFATEGEILSSPVVAAGTVYVGSTDNSVYALDRETGEQRWSYATGDMVEAPPLVVDGRVYVGSSDFFLYALDARTGELVWKFETMDRILGGANWFRGRDGRLRVVVGSYDANVYCLDGHTGRKHWAYETDNYVHGAPAVGDGEIVFGGCDAGLHLVDGESGARVTRIDLGEGCQVAGSVALGGDKAYFGHYGNEFLRVDLDSGEVDWTYRNRRQGFVSSPAVDDKHVVVGSRDKQLHCFLRADGSPQWTFKTRRKVDGSPVICGDKVVFGSGDGRLYLLRLGDGEELWSYDLGKSIYSSPAVSDGLIVIGAGDKRVYAFRAPADEAGREK